MNKSLATVPRDRWPWVRVDPPESEEDPGDRGEMTSSAETLKTAGHGPLHPPGLTVEARAGKKYVGREPVNTVIPRRHKDKNDEGDPHRTLKGMASGTKQQKPKGEEVGPRPKNPGGDNGGVDGSRGPFERAARDRGEEGEDAKPNGGSCSGSKNMATEPADGGYTHEGKGEQQSGKRRPCGGGLREYTTGICTGDGGPREGDGVVRGLFQVKKGPTDRLIPLHIATEQMFPFAVQITFFFF